MGESRLAALWQKARYSRAVGHASWVTGVFVFLQVLRLGSNIVLTHLLAPAIFGAMALINALRAGVELLTDVGIGQNIVVHDRGDEPSFYNTAWSIQVLRGVALTAIGLLAAWPLSLLYGKPELFQLLTICSSIFLMTGLNTPARFLMQRNREVRNLNLMDAFNQISGILVSIGFAALMPTVWGMTWALVTQGAIVMVSTYFLMDIKTLALKIDKEHLAAIFGFGKWIFLSSLVYFAATNFDRLYLPSHIPLALFGVYGISRSISDIATQLMQRLGGAIVFPAIAREGDALQQRMPRIVKLRSGGLALASFGLGCGIAISDVFVTLAYDARYHLAAVILPMLLAGSWFSIQSAISESILLGLAKPSRAAMANLLKLVLMMALVSFALSQGHVLIAFLVLALGDLPRYFVLLVSQHKLGLRFGMHDLALSALMLLSAVAFRAVLVSAGIVDGFVSGAHWAGIKDLLAIVAG